MPGYVAVSKMSGASFMRDGEVLVAATRGQLVAAIEEAMGRRAVEKFQIKRYV